MIDGAGPRSQGSVTSVHMVVGSTGKKVEPNMESKLISVIPPRSAFVPASRFLPPVSCLGVLLPGFPQR